MFNNIIKSCVEEKQRQFRTRRVILNNNSIINNKPVMVDKSTSTEDLVKQAKEKKKLEKFKKSVQQKNNQSALFKEVLGEPRNVEEVEDE